MEQTDRRGGPDLDGQLEVAERRPGTMTVVRAAGDLDVMSVPGLRAHLDIAFAGRRPVVLDLERVTFIDASGVRVLVEAQGRAARWGTTLLLRRPSRVVCRVLAVTGLLHAIDVEQTA